MKIKNIVILMFMIITVGLFPVKNHNSPRVHRRNLRRRKREKVNKYTENEFMKDLVILEKGLGNEIYNGLGYMFNGKNHKKIKKFK